MKQDEIIRIINNELTDNENYLLELKNDVNSDECYVAYARGGINMAERIKNIILAEDRAIAKGVKEILSRPLLEKEEKSV